MNPALPVFAVALGLGAADWYAVARCDRRFEYIFKPATLVAVIAAAALLTLGPHDARLAPFFLIGLVFSLAGDVFLMLPGTRFFVSGLASFLIAHVAYVAGLNPTLPPWPAPLLLVPVAALWFLLFRGVAGGLRRHGQTRLLGPVALYSVVLSLMLLSAWATLWRPEWSSSRCALAAAGGTLFFASDSMLAWDRFVTPSPSAHLRVMVTYHLAQIALALSISAI